MKILRSLSKPLLVVAALGTLLSLGLHLAALSGMQVQGAWLLVLFGALFLVGIPMSILYRDRVRGVVGPIRAFRAKTVGCPPWMIAIELGLMGYFIVTFFFMAATHQNDTAPKNQLPPWVLQMFSAGGLSMFFSSFTMYYSLVREQTLGILRACRNAHRVSATAAFCETCGAPLP